MAKSEARRVAYLKWQRANRDHRHAYNKRYIQLNPEKVALWAKKSKLKKAYGLTIEAYEALLQAQDTACAICRQSPTEKKPLCVDHDHKTGRIRGLLCTACNLVLGNAHDNPSILESAIRYISHN